MEAAGDRLIDLRNRAILAVAYDAMLRRSELVALQVVDMKIDMGGSASLLVRRGKTDPRGAGATLYLHRDSVTLVRRISGHSPRVGAAQDMIASGIETPAILQAGRWKSASMVQRYGERLLAKRNGAAQLARLQKRE